MYTSQGYFICDYEDWIKYGCDELCWSFKYDKASKKLNSFYPYSNTKQSIYFCRLIMEAQKGEYIDHQNGCSLDCRRKNLRKCSNKENSRNDRLHCNNSSGYSGVSWHKMSGKWRARITVDRKEIYLGLYDNYEDAVNARKIAEEKYFQDYSTINSRGEENRIAPLSIDKIISKILKGEDI